MRNAQRLIYAASTLMLWVCSPTAMLKDGPGVPAANARTADPEFRSQANTAAGRLPATLGSMTTDVVADGLDSPWGFDFLPDGRILVTEKAGTMSVMERGSGGAGRITPLSGVPDVASRGQGGLLDVAASPRFSEDQTIFFTFSEPVAGGARTSVARARLDGSTLSDLRIIFRQSPVQRTAQHFGSRIVFEPDGHLLIGLGERNNPSLAQALDNTIGKVVRITRDGSVPPDNPFVGRQGIAPEIYSYGHRNIQGATLHPDTGRLLAIEHGPQGGDELNRVERGGNHGWPRITRGVQYGSGTPIGEGTAAAGIVAPMVWWTPVSIAPSGLAFYRGDKVPALTNHLLAGSLSARALIALTMLGDDITAETRFETDRGERIRQVREGPDGYPWLLTDQGRLLRIVATRGDPG